MTFEQSSEEVREASMPICGGKAIPKWEKGKCKGTEAEADIVYLQINHLTVWSRVRKGTVGADPSGSCGLWGRP